MDEPLKYTETRYCMGKDLLRNELDALAYMTECTLATVCDLACKAKPPKGELSRQITIAQTGIDWVKVQVKPGMKIGHSRVTDIIDAGITVEQWAEKYRQK